MNNHDEVFIFSTGEDDEDYGLYIMDINCPLHVGSSYLMYYFDGDKFIHRSEKERENFVSGSEIELVKDEFGNQYVGEALKKRMLECVKAYKKELPGYVAYIKKFDERMDIID